MGPAQSGPVPLISPTAPLVPRAGALVRHSSFLSSVRTQPGLPEEEGRAFPAWKEAITGSGLGVWGAQEAAEPRAHPEAWPLHVAISTSAGPGAVPWLGSPGSPQLLWGTAGLGGSALCPGHGATCAPRFSPSCGGTDQAVGQDSSVVGTHNTNTRFPSAFFGFFGCFLGSSPRSSSRLKKGCCCSQC